MPSIPIRPTWNAGYALRAAAQPRALAVLLHGFQQTGEIMVHLLEQLFDKDTVVLAPNAPFPTPYKAGKRGLRMGYAWYMFDVTNNTYLIDMSFAVAYVGDVIEALGYGHLPKKVIGFSQGGYIAPFLAEDLGAVSQVVGVNSRYRDEAIDHVMPFRLDAVQGMNDQMVDPQRAKTCHEAVIARGNRGYFKEVADTGHMLNGRLLEAIGEVLRLEQ